MKIFSILFTAVMLIGCSQQSQDNSNSTVSSDSQQSQDNSRSTVPSGNEVTQNLQQEKNYCAEYKKQVKTINLQINLLQNVAKFDPPDNLAKTYYLNQKTPGKMLEQCIAEAFYIDGTSGHIVFTISEVDDGQIYLSIQDASAYMEVIRAEEFIRELQKRDKQNKEETKEEKQEQIPETQMKSDNNNENLAHSDTYNDLSDKPKPSFDCQKTLTSVEKMICADLKLSRLDFDMANRYKEIYSITPNRELLIVEHKDWLRKRNHCHDINCLQDSYSLRIAELEADYEQH